MNIKNTRLFWFIKNICALWRCDIYKDISELKYSQSLLSKDLRTNKDRELCIDIMMYYDIHKEIAPEFENELIFLRKNGFSIFPYDSKGHNRIEAKYDLKKGMTYVEHKGKRLYFPPFYDKDLVEMVYRRLYEMESITSDGLLEKSPHQYQSDTFKIEEGDVLVDVGCAEALLSLDVIDKVKKVYLIESDLRWMPALEATFAPYKDKVVFINKLVTDIDSDTTITLATLLKEEQDNSLFIKMDIEGYETQVIESSREFLLKHHQSKLACCTYHKVNDAEILETIFHDCDYETEFSEGYMLFCYGWLQPPYFRKGVIRAQKRN